jgi:EmrB/QacA subfamily drug resistance transporter
MTSLPVAALVIALPTIRRELDVGFDELQWTLNAYTIAYTASLILAGRLGDVFGRRRLFLGGTALYGCASVFAALSSSVWWLVGSIALVAIGAAALTPAALSIIRSSFPADGRGRAIALWGGASTLVSGVAPAIGGLLTDDLGWQWIFGVNAIVAAGVFALGVRVVAESRDTHADRHIDVIGALLLAPTLVLLSFGLIEAGDIGWTSIALNAIFATAILLFAVFVLFERRARAPLVDFELRRRPAFTGAKALGFAFNFALSALFFLLPLYLQYVHGFSALETGVLMLPQSCALAVALPLGRVLAARTDPRVPMFGGLALSGAGIYFFSDLSLSTTYSDLWPALALVGFGLGLSLTPRNIVAMNAVPSAEAGMAAGVITTVSGFGAALGVAISGTAFEELRLSKLEHVLAKTGPHLSDEEQRRAVNFLANTPTTRHDLAQLPAASARLVLHAVRDAFVVSIGGSLQLSVLVAVAGIAVAAVMMRGRLSTDDGGE